MNQYKWSNFRIRVPIESSEIVIKSTLTGAVVRMNSADENCLTETLRNDNPIPEDYKRLSQPEIGLLIPRGYDEFTAWQQRFVEKRNSEAHTFTLHFLPTTQCQLSCSYCFQRGSNRIKEMSKETMARTYEWLEQYLDKHPEIDSFRLVLFGGEPLLCKDIIQKGLDSLHLLAKNRGLDFWTELTTNGELLDEETARLLSNYRWLRVQITLDGPEDIHNQRRPGKSGRPTFQNVISAIWTLISTDYIEKVDIRISLDYQNVERIPELIQYLASFGVQERMDLSLGLIKPTLKQPEHERAEEERMLGEKAVAVWAVAQQYGFKIPDEFITGPWCVAIARHAAVLQPNGALQKCFCTVGRTEYDFTTISDPLSEYLCDPRFENWQRTDQCIKEKCSLLPICGGGCIHDAIVAHQGPKGSAERYCQKSLIRTYNEGLLRLNYSQ